jgi:hypothetical protein
MLRGIAALAAAGVCVLAITSAALASPAGDKTCRVKRACAHHGTTYTVTKVRVARSIGTGFMKKSSAGVFLLVNVTMVNTKSDSSTILGSNLTIATRGGDRYDLSSDALGTVDGALLLLESLQPKLAKRVVLVYELPKSALRGARLEINDTWSGDKARIALGV